MAPKKNSKAGAGGSKSKAATKSKSVDNLKAASAGSKQLSTSTSGTDLDSYRTATGTLISQKRALDVKIGGFSLQSYGQVLINETEIELSIGRRYGLIGSNGSGKTTFLRCLGNREVPIPDHIDIYLLENEAEPSELNAMEWVVSQAKDEVKRLEEQVESLTDHQAKLAEEGIDVVDDPETDALVQDIYSRLDEMDPDTFEVRAGRLLTGLGFDKKMLAKPTKDMSGGWRMRVALARALFVKPTLLLLDEPTNHLDLEACVWLEEYLRNYNRCLVLVSHSQDFLNNTTTNTIHLTPKKQLVTYGGNYDTFVQVKAEAEVNQMKAYKKEQEDIAKIKQFVASAGTYANLVKQAKSKLKIIEKMEERGLTEKVTSEHTFKFNFPECERLPPPILMFENVAFSYDGIVEHALYKNLSFGVDQDSRIALVGPNGAGKSTLLKLMVGEIMPTVGQVRRHMHLTFARYNQHSTDILDASKSALEFIPTMFPAKKMEETGWRQQIGKYGITGTMQTTPMGKLSDGMKARIIFGILSMQHPHILLLDEPTNHLDMECIDALADAINTFTGGLVLVSHDFRLLSQVARTIWVCDNKTVKPWDGTIQSYKQHLVKRMRAEDAKFEASIKKTMNT